jgi:muramoyltetrapeptide carboxypeptidase LdcA involved in peptidoglycan recycling
MGALCTTTREVFYSYEEIYAKKIQKDFLPIFYCNRFGEEEKEFLLQQ